MKTASLLLALAFSLSAASAALTQTGKTDTGPVKVTDAGQLGRDLNDKGRSNVYGILFEAGEAEIKPESEPQLAAIAELLTKNPGLRIDVLGHTEIQGGAGDNLRLSDLRAFAVVAELSLRYKIDRARLNPLGKGQGQPVASNAEEAGRALNRRVELVRR
jgi:OOP family OmpA-OmpF porin